MRMHRGSSKGTGAGAPGPETLPLSVLPAVTITFHSERAGRAETRTAQVPLGSTLRAALRSVGWFGEGSAVLDDGRPVPLDTRIESDRTLTVVPTFSGG
jgi:sulfur carrier protein ThiS